MARGLTRLWYMSKRSIRELFHISHQRASEIFRMAEEKDERELSYRLYPDRVRTESVKEVCGLTDEQFTQLMDEFDG